jgi:hypothetical protein
MHECPICYNDCDCTDADDVLLTQCVHCAQPPASAPDEQAELFPQERDHGS